MMPRKKITFNRWKEYDGMSNEHIKDLIIQWREAHTQEMKLREAIDNAEKECEHEYLFLCSGMYEDSYACSKCGHQTEK